jgi:hypothetical protein
MSLPGIHFTLLIGPSVPVPAPPYLIESLQNVEVTHNDDQRSGFQITFSIGRNGPQDLLDYQHLSTPLLRPFNRVVLVVTFNSIPRVIMDGIITNHQMQPGSEPGTSTLTITGDDVSLMMDREERSVEHIGQPDMLIVTKIILNYAQYGLIPKIIPPLSIDQPIPIERTPVQRGTDLEYLNILAERYGYVFYIIPGPVPLTNTAYWGPPVRIGVPQSALTFNMGPQSNVSSVNFQYNALDPVIVSGNVTDRQTNQSMPVQTFTSTRLPLATQSALLTNLPNVRRVRPENSEGLNYMQAMTRAQARTDSSLDSVVTGNGELDALQYSDILIPRGLVGLRGAGYSYDGLYYVKRVTHIIRNGEYKQRFSLSREGMGATTPVVRT